MQIYFENILWFFYPINTEKQENPYKNGAFDPYCFMPHLCITKH